MALLQLSHRHPQLTIYTLLLLVLGVVATVLHGYFAEMQTERQLTRYGQMLADGGATRAVEPALAQDMVSLQVILKSLTAQPGVAGATIHDVENRLWVQSGEAAEERQLRFTAPITLDDQIAGYLTLTLARAEEGHMVLFLGLWWGVLAVTILGLWGHIAYRERQVGKARPPSDDDREEVAEEEATAEAEVGVDLCFLNIESLRQQLSHEHFVERLRCFDKQLAGVLALYEGRRAALDGDTLMLKVTGDTPAGAAFYALCICQLLFTLNHARSSPRLHIAADIKPVAPPAGTGTSLAESLAQAPKVARQPLPPGITLAPSLISDELRRRADINEHCQLQAIKPPYSELLQRQQRQLSQL